MPSTGIDIKPLVTLFGKCLYQNIFVVNRSFTADLSPSKRVFATGVRFLMGDGEPVPYDPLSFYHGVLIGQLSYAAVGITRTVVRMCCHMTCHNWSCR